MATSVEIKRYAYHTVIDMLGLEAYATPQVGGNVSR